MVSKNYITKEGETWGSVAYKQYGSMAGIAILIRANPLVPIDSVLPTGTVLICPIQENTATALITDNLPPWK